MQVNIINITEPLIDSKGKTTLHKEDRITAEESIVAIARVSTSREDLLGDYQKLLLYLIRNKHWSPFEHVFITFEVVTSRAIGREILRHRSLTFQEFSQRYAVAIQFEQVEWREAGTTNRQGSLDETAKGTYQLTYLGGEYSVERYTDYWLSQIQSIYREMIEKNVAKESARFILPECTQTKIYATGSLRSWIHFLELRLAKTAQKEIRLIAQEINEILKFYFPNVWEALKWYHAVFNDGEKSKQQIFDKLTVEIEAKSDVLAQFGYCIMGKSSES